MRTDHGHIDALSTESISTILEQGYVGHLGCYSGHQVYVVPITYAYADGYIYSHSQVGKKIKMMRKHPNICIQVEEVQSTFQWRSAIAWGHYEELKDDMAATAMRLLISKIVKNEGRDHISDLEVDLKAMLDTAVIYRMKVEKSTGRFETFD